jgi:hypothetical protein
MFDFNIISMSLIVESIVFSIVFNIVINRRTLSYVRADSNYEAGCCYDSRAGFYDVDGQADIDNNTCLHTDSRSCRS